MDTAQEKLLLRQEMRGILRSITDREKRSQSMLKTFLETDLLQNVQFVSVFISFPEEVDTTALIEHFRSKNLVVCVPEHTRHDPAQPIVMREWVKDGELEEVRPGLFHPKYGPIHRIEEIDLLLVPGLAFTTDGARLGRGGGFYDRLLANVLGKSVGLCYLEQVKATLPTESHDIRVSEVISG